MFLNYSFRPGDKLPDVARGPFLVLWLSPHIWGDPSWRALVLPDVTLPCVDGVYRGHHTISSPRVDHAFSIYLEGMFGNNGKPFSLVEGGWSLGRYAEDRFYNHDDLPRYGPHVQDLYLKSDPNYAADNVAVIRQIVARGHYELTPSDTDQFLEHHRHLRSQEKSDIEKRFFSSLSIRASALAYYAKGR